MRRSVLGALVASVAVALAGIGGAVAILRAQPPAPDEAAVRVVSGDALSVVPASPTTSVPMTAVPTSTAPASAPTTTTKPRSVSTTVAVPVPTSARPTIPPRPRRPPGSTMAPLQVTPTTVPFVAHPRHCTAMPAVVEVSYGQWVPVRIIFNFDMYVGARVALRDGGPDSVPSLATWSTVDSTGRGADFLVGVGQPWTYNGVLEPAGSPHTFSMDDMDCSVRVIPH